MTKRSSEFGRSNREFEIDKPDPWSQDKLKEQERDGISPTDNQIGIKWLNLGRFKIPVGFRVAIGTGIRFRLPRQRGRNR